jgi:hypothetical protein
VLVYPIAQARVPDLIEAHELVEGVGAAVWQHEPME